MYVINSILPNKIAVKKNKTEDKLITIKLIKTINIII